LKSAIENLPLVSIVIPMFNESETIERCLNSIFSQDYPREKIEILVADGGSTDGAMEKVESLGRMYSGLRIVENPKRRTPAGLNAGIRSAKGDIVVILGAHTRIKEDFLRQNVEAMHRERVHCTGGTQVNVGDTYMQKAIGIAMGSPFGLPSAPYRFSKSEKFVDTVVYAAYKRSLFDEVGFFDEELFISEDAEMNWRIRKAGHRIFYTPEIVSYYYPRRTIASLFKQLFRYGILRVNVIKKHMDAVKWVHLVPFLFLTGLILLILFRKWTLFTFLLGFYVLAVVYYSLRSAIRDGFRYLPVLPLLFMTIHLSWGLGFIVGLFKSQERCPKPSKS
jgi:cellulose synthase/poly-beta-1,6-N-acetylglucosamine synthase-like glycosyltransferase